MNLDVFGDFRLYGPSVLIIVAGLYAMYRLTPRPMKLRKQTPEEREALLKQIAVDYSQQKRRA